jgi:hypothetical protein
VADGTGAPAILVRDVGRPILLRRSAPEATWTPFPLPDRWSELAPLDTGWELVSIDAVPDPAGSRTGLVVQPWTVAGPGIEEVAYRWPDPEPIQAIGFAGRTATGRRIAWAAGGVPHVVLAVESGGGWTAQAFYEQCGLVRARIGTGGKVDVVCETTEWTYPPDGNRFWVELVEP